MPLASDSRQVAAAKGGGTGDVTEEAGGEHTQKGSNSDGRSEGRMQELRAAAAALKRETCAEATTWSSPRQGPNRSNEGSVCGCVCVCVAGRMWFICSWDFDLDLRLQE